MYVLQFWLMMLLSLENDPEVLLDGYYLINGSVYHINVCIIQFYLIRFYKLCIINFLVCRLFSDLSCKEISMIHIYNVKLVLHYLLCFS
jgi:hypothetical protein